MSHKERLVSRHSCTYISIPISCLSQWRSFGRSCFRGPVRGYMHRRSLPTRSLQWLCGVREEWYCYVTESHSLILASPYKLLKCNRWNIWNKCSGHTHDHQYGELCHYATWTMYAFVGPLLPLPLISHNLQL
jgi:hypothetical protein